MPRPLIYHVALVAKLRRTVSVVAASCKQSQITLGCYAAFLSYKTFGVGELRMRSQPPGGINSCVIILYYTLCKETRGEHERPVALYCERGVVVGEQE